MKCCCGCCSWSRVTTDVQNLPGFPEVNDNNEKKYETSPNWPQWITELEQMASSQSETFFNHIISIWRFRSVLYQRVSSYVSSVTSFHYRLVSFILTSVTFYRNQSYFSKWPLQHVATIHVVRKSNLSTGLSSNWSVPVVHVLEMTGVLCMSSVKLQTLSWPSLPDPYSYGCAGFHCLSLSFMCVCFGDTSVWPNMFPSKAR